VTSAQQIQEDVQEFKRYHQQHSYYLAQIKELDDQIDELSPFQIAKLEYIYSKAERIAWHIAGFYKRKQKSYEGQAEIKQGQEYKRLKEENQTSVDAQYGSRVTKGEMLDKAADYEGEYISWRGIAQTYERAGNSLKDMIKAIEKEGGGQ